MGRSFTYKRNRRGPRIVPCGTPDEVKAEEERLLLTKV